MRKAALIGTIVAVCAGAARADFVVTGYGYPGPIDDVYEVYALDNGASGTGTLAVSNDVTLYDFRPFFGGVRPGTGFVFKFVDNTFFAPADLTASALYASHGNNPSALFGGNQDRTFINILGDEPSANPNLYNVTLDNPENDNTANYRNPTITMWEQAGTVPGGVDASSAANGGRGALIAVAVIPHGEILEATGIVHGVALGNDFTWVSPEPGVPALLSVGLGALALRRSRA